MSSFETTYIEFGCQKVDFTSLLDAISKLDEKLLREVNNRVVTTLNGIQKRSSENKIAKIRNKYSTGSRIIFKHKDRFISGTIKTINRRTISLVDCSDGGRWRIGPSSIIGAE